MDTSKFLCKAIGIYLIILSIVMLLDMQRMVNIINGFLGNPSLVFVTGIFTLILGILLVVSHNIWVWDWRVIITIISWLVLIKGVSVVITPQFVDSITAAFIENVRVYYSAAIFDLCLGIILSYIGYIR